MARSTVYNSITCPEKLGKVGLENKHLGENWLEYIQLIDRFPQSLVAYYSDLLGSKKDLDSVCIWLNW